MEGWEQRDEQTDLTVLVVDDSSAVRRRAEGVLKKAGHRVATAADGFSALAVIVNEQPDLILADEAMPRLDGYQLCALIRHNPQLLDIPVILLTGHSDLFQQARAEGVGSTACLEKPFAPENLLALIERYRPTVRAH